VGARERQRVARDEHVTREAGEIIGVYAAPGALLVARKDVRRVRVDGYS
jgi:hypothetical protein